MIIIHTSAKENTKKVSRKLVMGALYENKIYLINKEKKIFYLYSNNKNKKANVNVKKAKQVYIDLNTHNVYDAKTIKTSNPIIIGKVKDNKLVK